jgi:hypothetical protein
MLLLAALATIRAKNYTNKEAKANVAKATKAAKVELEQRKHQSPLASLPDPTNVQTESGMFYYCTSIRIIIHSKNEFTFLEQTKQERGSNEATKKRSFF